MTLQTLRLGISPCPNDTFIFAALLDGRAGVEGCEVRAELLDVEELNARAKAGSFDVCKVSAAAAAGLAGDWLLLRAGGALGRGVGPLLVARPGTVPADLDTAALAVPGLATTGHLLLRLYARSAGFGFTPEPMLFSDVMEAVASGDNPAGVVIHEGRFTYGDKGLTALADLGAWWEESHGLPVPLGLIAIRRDLGSDLAARVNQAIVRSLKIARNDPESVMALVHAHAQEMSPEVVRRHIQTFVMDFSLDVGEEGERACLALMAEAALMSGIRLPESDLFLPG